ncbi:MAG: IS3 family transposase [Nitrospirae bacterium]|nr:MAG: IS3 family transposase [Nitrospirota bacterium]
MKKTGIPQGRYTKEFREEAVKMVSDGNISLPEAARRLSLPPSTLGNWVKAYKAGKLSEVGKTQRPLTEVEIENYRLKRELAEMKMERDILKKAAGVLCEGVAARYAWMRDMRLQYPIPVMSRVLSVSTSGYYAWLKRPLSKRAKEEARLEVEIIAAHNRTRQTYGPERLQHELAAHGVRAGVCRIKRIRRKLGIRCKQAKKFKVTTDSKHSLPVAENILQQQFEATEPKQVYVTDITYIPTEEGWLYLAGHKDLFTKEIVGYAMGERLTKSLVSESLFRAVAANGLGDGLIHHSDRGSQYCSYEYGKLLKQFEMEVSMSGKGNCYDNAPMESFWGTLKQELVHYRRYKSRQEAVQDITEYIEIFYNRQRIQAKLGFLSPAAYKQKFYAERKAA